MGVKIYTICLWIWRICLLNVLWIVFTVIGCIVFGVVPASLATASVCRKWLTSRDEFPLVRHFIQSYKELWLRTLPFTLFFSLIISGLFLVFIRFQLLDSLFSLIIITYFFLSFEYFCFSFVHFELSFFGYIQHGLLLPLICPVQSILLVMINSLIVVLIRLVPGLLPFVPIVATAIASSSLMLPKFAKLRRLES